MSSNQPLVIYLILISETFTPQLRWFLDWTVWMIRCCVLGIMHIIVLGFLTPILWMLTGVASAGAVFSGWSAQIMQVIIEAFMLASALDNCGLLFRISTWVILKVGGTLTRTCWALFIIGFILCFITFSNAYVIMAPFTYGVAKSMKIKLPSKEGMAIMMSAILGVLSTRMFIYAPSVILMLEQGARAFFPEYTMMWYHYMLHNVPVALFLLFFMFLLTKIYKTNDYEGDIDLEDFRASYEAMGPLSKSEKKAIVGLTILMIILLSGPFTGIPSTIPFLLIPILLYLPGISVGNEQAMKQNIDFAMLTFIAACIGIGNVGASLGIGDILVDNVAPMLQGQSTTVTLIGILLFGVLANFMMTPTAMLVALSGPLAVIADTIHLPISMAMYTLAHATDLVFLPYEFVPYLIFFSFGFSSMGEFLKINSIRVALYFVFFAVIMIPFWHLLGVS